MDNLNNIKGILINNSNKDLWIDTIACQKWSAALYLSKCLNDQKMFDSYFGCGNAYVFTIDDKFLGFATLSQKDCIVDETISPWIGFLFVNEEFRGNRYSQKIMEYLENIALNDYNHHEVYICTNHVGLYEKYGYQYLYDRVDIFNEINRVYVKKLK